SYDGTLRAVEQSLQRLGIDRIDILLIHDVDVWTHGSAEAYEQRYREAVAGAAKALVELRAQGVVRAIGVIAALDHEGARPVFSGGTSLSVGWGLIQRFSEDAGAP
ncbi:aldo/keto reductase, partial [Metallibacterium scheffleri]|uniref:aldo/keto reductase n=1 Tax=Metallibacterium scheffleri TaxID=993689 RepID=UPI0023F5953F